ncbi:MAG: site-2 protease family protein [Patescibacteria group bacterium]|nr:site-2 protease family protein [Patescibacteria group bacterium]MDE2172424.1 site-2 protease family protein [Patescibacteria group bacterium]
MLTILTIIILIFSVIVHEVSHGLMALRLGDPTARLQGRLTLNPLKHIDPIGSIVVPIITSLSGFTFGWAKPVIYNPYNLRNRRTGEFLIALAGPVSNLTIAVVFSLIMRVYMAGANAALTSPFLQIVSYIVLINLVLALFNLIPVPPLDGSKLFLSFLPHQYGKLRYTLERLGPLFLIVVVLVVWQLLSPLVAIVFRILTGVAI